MANKTLLRLRIRPHFFYLFDYVTRRSEKLDFQKKKKKILGFIGKKRPSDAHLCINAKVTLIL